MKRQRMSDQEKRRFVAYRETADTVIIRFIGGPLDGAAATTDEWPHAESFVHHVGNREYTYRYRQIERAIFEARLALSDSTEHNIHVNDHAPTGESHSGHRVPSGLIFFVCGISSLTLLSIGGWLTGFGLGPWYQSLNFPPFQPPAWLFTPVWVVVMALLAVATWIVTCKARVAPVAACLALALYGAQLVLNAGWSLLFFALKRPDIALWNLFVLDGILLLMIFSYRRISKTAGQLIVPYFLWLLFATAINWWIVSHNPPFVVAG